MDQGRLTLGLALGAVMRQGSTSQVLRLESPQEVGWSQLPSAAFIFFERIQPLNEHDELRAV
jgi:hypothetical protein